MSSSVLSHDTQADNLLSDRLVKSNISIIKEMMYLAHEEEKKGKNIVSLGVGIPHYKMPSYIREEVVKSLQQNENIDKYTFFAGIPSLRQEIARQSSLSLSLPVTEDNIIVTPGSMAALLYSFTAMLNQDDEVIVLSPYFASYSQQIQLSGGKIVEVALIEPDDNNSPYSLDIPAIKKAVTPKTKAILINSPSNPTGAVYKKEELEELAQFLIGKRIYVITDEVYEYLVYDNVSYFNIATIKELWPYVIRCCSFSKIFGMTGWRIGYLHTNTDLVKQILKIHDNTIVCAPHVAQVAVQTGITKNSFENKQNRDSLEHNRALMCERLNKLPDLFSYIKPQGAYYLFPRFHFALSSIEFAKKLLYETGVVVVPGIGFGKVGEGHVRLSFGGTPTEINEAFDRIEKWWKGMKKE